MRRILVVVALALVSSCSDDDLAGTVDAAVDAAPATAPQQDASAVGPDGSVSDVGPATTGSLLERPTDPLPRPPTDRLPPDLFPPR